jgi:hypothetical protein
MMNYPANNKVEICSLLDKTFRIVFPSASKDSKISIRCGEDIMKGCEFKASGGSVEFRAQTGNHYFIECR